MYFTLVVEVISMFANLSINGIKSPSDSDKSPFNVSFFLEKT